MAWQIRGKRVLITGGTTGIGRATVEELTRRGADVVFTARSKKAGEAVVAEVRSATGREPLHRELHLDDLASVRALGEELRADLPGLEVLINNAGVVMTERRETKDGFEYTFGVNHLGHFLLVQEVLPLLEAAGSARVVIVASDAHRFVRGLDFDDLHSARGRFGAAKGMVVYSRSKLANVLHTRALAGRLPEGITVNAVHPGAVRTRLGRDGERSRLGEVVWPLFSRFALTPEKGARTSVWAATAPELDGVTGGYFAREAVANPSKAALDAEAADRLWQASEELVSE